MWEQKTSVEVDAYLPLVTFFPGFFLQKAGQLFKKGWKKSGVLGKLKTGENTEVKWNGIL